MSAQFHEVPVFGRRTHWPGWRAVRTVLVMAALFLLAASASAAEAHQPAPTAFWPYLLMLAVLAVALGLVWWVAWDAVTMCRQRTYDRQHSLHDAAREAWRIEHERREQLERAGHVSMRVRRLFERAA